MKCSVFTSCCDSIWTPAEMLECVTFTCFICLLNVCVGGFGGSGHGGNFIGGGHSGKGW